MMRIAVCDDEIVYTDLIADHLELMLRMQSVDVTVLRYTDAASLVAEHKKEPFDALFLDIDMPELSGFEAAREVRRLNHEVYIIFVTAKHELVFDSFEYTPFYFLCKATQDDLRRDLSNVMRKLMVHFRQNRKLTIQDSTYGENIVALRDILYICSEKHYLLYYTADNALVPYKERGTIAEKEIEFYAYRFIRPHQRYLVNVNHIDRFDCASNTITLTTGEQLPISKAMKDEAFRKYKEYKRK